MKTLLVLILCVLARQICSAQIYVSQSGAGAQDGTSAANAYAMTWLTNASNWGGGAGQVGPGETVLLMGTITQGLPIQGGGSPGNPILISLAGGNFTSPSWSDAALRFAAIYDPSFSYITIDGGGTGYISATACGSGLANPYGCSGIWFSGGVGLTVQNLSIFNLFVRHAGDTNALGNGDCVNFNGSGMANLLVTNVTMHDACVGVNFTFGGTMTNAGMANCTAYNVNWGGTANDTGSESHLYGLNLMGNHFFSWQNWDDPADFYHHNGFYAYLANSGTMTNVAVSGNTVGPGFGSDNTSGLFFSGPITSILVASNIFLATDGTSPANGLLTVGLGGSSIPSGATIVNNSFIGSAQNSTALSISGGDGSSLTFYGFTNNIFQSVEYALFATFVGQATFAADFNDYFSLPSQAWSFSDDSNPSTKTYAQWQAFGFDPHAQTGNPNLNLFFVPQAPSAALGTGASVSPSFVNFMGGRDPGGHLSLQSP